MHTLVTKTFIFQIHPWQEVWQSIRNLPQVRGVIFIFAVNALYFSVPFHLGGWGSRDGKNNNTLYKSNGLEGGEVFIILYPADVCIT